MRSTGPNTGYRNIETTIDRLYLKVNNETYGLKGETLIGFTELATDGFDQNYDSKRLATTISIYSLINDRELGIQGRTVFNEEHIIPLGFTIHVEENQEYIISISAIEGEFISNATVYLKDKLLYTPTQNILNIISPQTEITGIEVFDVRGRKVNTIDFKNKSNYQVDLTSFKNLNILY